VSSIPDLGSLADLIPIIDKSDTSLSRHSPNFPSKSASKHASNWDLCILSTFRGRCQNTPRFSAAVSRRLRESSTPAGSISRSDFSFVIHGLVVTEAVADDE
jgi:hypothetical protein